MPPEVPEGPAVGAHSPASRFGRYLLERRIAVGGTSEVFLARRADAAESSEKLVIKRLLPALQGDANAIGMFATEARLHRLVNHPNVVKVFEAGVVDGEPYLAMEYVEGVDAFRLLRRLQTEERTLRIHVAIYIARAVCDALAAVHAAKDDSGAAMLVLHRDVTPSNIYLSSNGHVRLGDFGIARTGTGRASRASVGAGIKGKYGYLSPEQVCGESCDRRSDLFSLGVVASELVLGHPLFPGSGQLAVLLAIRDGRIDSLTAAADTLPPGLYEVLARTLSREPNARFGTADELSQALAPFEQPGRAESVAALHRWVAWARDTDDLTRRLKGAITGSNDRLVAASNDAAPPDPPTLPPPADPTTWPRPDPDEPPTTRRKAQLSIRPFAADEPVTARFDEVPSRVRVNGDEIATVTFARIIEMIVSGEIASEDEVDLMGQGFLRVHAIDLLARHLPDEMTTRSVRTPAPPDQTFDLGLGLDLGAPPALTLVDLLGRFFRLGETGFLLVEGTPPGESTFARREIYFKAGALHHVGSSDVSELLGQSLVRRGILTLEELDMALAVLSKFDGRLGDTLVALGLIDAMELFRAIEEQGRERLLRLFGWHAARASFYRGALPTRVEFPLELELAELMLAGAEVALTDEAALQRFRPYLSQKLKRAPREAAPRRRSPLPKPLVIFMDTLGAGMELKQVLMRLNTTGALTAGEALRAMQVALALGLIEES